MKKHLTRREFGATTLGAVAATAIRSPYVRAAEKKYDAGASDTEIKLGQTVPHSGPGSLYGVLGRVGEGLRYAHAADHVRAKVTASRLDVVHLEAASPRNEDNEPVQGLVIVAAKT